MTGARDRKLKSRDGAVIVVVALMIVVIIGMAAFAIDIGMLLSARADAQRAADAAALAAASAYMDAPLADRQTLAEARGTDFATRNEMLHDGIAAGEVQIVMVTNTAATLRVRATVRRPAVSTFFAGIWGKNTLPVAAAAEAEVRSALGADCLKPFALPDTDFPATGEGGKWGQPVKVWVVGGEEYVLVGFNDNEPPGLGNIEPFISNKCVDGQSAALEDELLWEKPGNAQPGQGGDGVGQVRNGMEKLLASDPTLEYDPESPSGFSRDGVPEYNWGDSPRVGNVVIYNYDEMKASGTSDLRVLNFARVFFDYDENKGANPNNPYTVWGRVFPAAGTAGGGVLGADCTLPGSCVIRLVQ